MAQTLKPFRRHVDEGERIAVEGLNHLNVLIDRSQTALTEVGRNVAPAGMQGAPHHHDEKEQVFFILSGSGTVVVSGEVFPVQPGDLLHIPLGTMHRTLADAATPLVYLLFNAFANAGKEGHATFVAHVAVSGPLRQRQAADAAAGLPIDWQRTADRGRCLHVAPDAPRAVPDGLDRLSLFGPPQTRRVAADLLRLPPHQRNGLTLHPDAEKTLYVLRGNGAVAVDGQRFPLSASDVMYLPGGGAATLAAGDAAFAVLCLSTRLS